MATESERGRERRKGLLCLTDRSLVVVEPLGCIVVPRVHRVDVVPVVHIVTACVCVCVCVCVCGITRTVLYVVGTIRKSRW